jgi:RNA polymerase sigma factor (sigma-70 family)
MPTSQSNRAIEHLRRALLTRDGGGLTDGQLLGCYIEHKDEAAFEALVRRHGPMVLAVCRRLLQDDHAAEDAFQATFLVLVRRATAIRPREMLPNWLYGVAYQTARKTRAAAARRRATERQVVKMPEPEVVPPELWHELQPVLDYELGRLPDKYRVPVVLCELEGKTQKEAAQQLGWPPGTVSSRLARAKSILARRLTQRGLALSAGSLAILLSRQGASARVPASLLEGTIKAASLFALGRTATAGTISAQVEGLTRRVLKTMLLSKIRNTLVVVLAVTCLGTGIVLLQIPSQAADPPASPEKKEAAGKEGDQAKAAKDEDAIQGTWTVVRLDQVNHEPTDEEKAYWAKGLFKVVITADKLIFPDKSEGKYKLDSSKDPKRFDLTVEDNKRTGMAPGIYSLKGDELTICYGRAGDWLPPTDFDVKKAKAGSFPSCWTLKRDKGVADKKTP